MTPELPGHERRDRRRLERTLDEDLPGAPPGYLRDPDDERTHAPVIAHLGDDGERQED